MALQRQHLAPVDGFDDRIHWQPLFDRWNQQVLRWVLGPGFLSLHLALFGTLLLSALTWNLIVDPADIQIAGPFRYWGIVAVVHTVLLGGGLIGWKLFHMGQPDTPRFAPAAPVAHRHQIPAGTVRTPAWQPAWARGAESAGRVSATARSWVSTPAQPSEPGALARDTETGTGWPEVPAIFRTAAIESQTAESPASDTGEATWPESAPRSTTLAGSAQTNPADEVVSVDHRDAAGDQPKTWIDGFIESRSKDKEHRWSWVEAAAAAWLNRREVEGSNEKALPATTDPRVDTAAPVTPEDPNQPHLPSA